jgi:hypothetical protein
MQLNSVVLPPPFGPMMLKISPRCTWKETLSTARKPPNCCTTPRTSRRISPSPDLLCPADA